MAHAEQTRAVKLMGRGGERELAKAPGRKSPRGRRGGRSPKEKVWKPVEDAKTLLNRVSEWEKQDGAEARAAMRRACAEVINAYPKTAQKMRVSERLWKSWYGEVSGLQKQNPTGSGDLQELLAACDAFYAKLEQQLRGSLRRPNRSPDHREGLEDALQMALVARGDVARYKEADNKSVDWAVAKKFYQQARDVAPSNGKVFNQLGLLAVRDGKLLEGAYLYARSLACDKPFSSNSNLLHILQPGRLTEKAGDGPTSEAMVVYSAVARLCVHNLLTGKSSGQDWSLVVKKMQNALTKLLESWDPQDEGIPVVDTPLGPLADTVSAALLQVICLAIISAHSTECAIGKTSDRQTFGAFANWDGSKTLTQNALAFGSTALLCLVSKVVDVLNDSSETIRAKLVMNALLPAINIYLAWIHIHPSLLLKLASSDVQDGCVKLFHALSAKGFVERGLCCSKKYDGDLSVAVLPEDRELLGFLPCEKANDKPEDVESMTRNAQKKLTAEELLVLRTTRFMTLSEKFVFSGQPLPSAVSRSPPVQHPSTPAPSHRTLSNKRSAKADPFAIAPIHTGRLCVSCSNTSTFAGGECEYCGFEDEFEECTPEKHTEAPFSPPRTLNTPSPGKAAISPVRRRSSPVSSASSPQSDLSSSPPDTFEADFNTIMAIGAEHTEFQDGLDADKFQQRLIVIDAPNVAMRHGKGKVFSCAGIELAVKYFRGLGHRVVAFIPDYMLQSDEARAQHEEDGGTLTAAKIPDDVALLARMVQEGVLVPTPSQDYDDSYSIQYAGLHDGCVVTNDLFRDHIENMVGPRERKVAMRAWLRAHQISYSWVRNEFMPNPNFRFPEVTASTF